jgi:alkanesulfonate monooxygenase SsuD/methylene tetrahydromethanopterin reductase-like flavin-dependent oxidoreductase (luciferase family)
VILRDKAALGMSLPHRSPDPLAVTTVGTVARRAEELGFRDLWVTENTVDDGTCLDPVVALTFAASITKRIGVGAAVIVLPIHHPLTVANQWATLDFVSGGRAILAVGPWRSTTASFASRWRRTTRTRRSARACIAGRSFRCRKRIETKPKAAPGLRNRLLDLNRRYHDPRPHFSSHLGPATASAPLRLRFPARCWPCSRHSPDSMQI